MVNTLWEWWWSSKCQFILWLNERLNRVPLLILQFVLLRCYYAVLQVVWEAFLVNDVVWRVLLILNGLGKISVWLVSWFSVLAIVSVSSCSNIFTIGSVFNRNFSKVSRFILLCSVIPVTIEQHGVPHIQIWLWHHHWFLFVISWHQGFLWYVLLILFKRRVPHRHSILLILFYFFLCDSAIIETLSLSFCYFSGHYIFVEVGVILAVLYEFLGDLLILSEWIA